MPERVASHEQSSWMPTLTVSALAALGCIASDVKSLLAQQITPKDEQKLVQPEKLAKIDPAVLKTLIAELSDEEFKVRETAMSILAKHAHEWEVRRLLYKVVVDAEKIIAQNTEGKQPYQNYDVEQYVRVKWIDEKKPFVAGERSRVWKNKGPETFPYLSYIPEDAKLPPGLVKFFGGRDAFDVRLFIRQQPAVKDGVSPPTEPHGEFRRGAVEFVRLFREHAEADAVKSPDPADTRERWNVQLWMILQAWEEDDRAHKEATKNSP